MDAGAAGLTADPAAPARLRTRRGGAAAGWRAPAFAAAVALAVALPGLLATPALDRAESRVAATVAAVRDASDPPDLGGADSSPHEEPPGVRWLQAGAASAASGERQIQAYRLPSLAAAMLAAAACAWGAAAFLAPSGAALAGGMLGASWLLASQGAIATADAPLCAAVTLALGALARLYAQARGLGPAGRGTRALLWTGLTAGVLLGGWTTLAAAAAPVVALALADRRARWLRELGWGWGAALLVAAAGPWTIAAVVRSDGSVLSRGVAEAAAAAFGPRLGLDHAPALHVLAAPLLVFPGTLLLPAAAAHAWRARGEPGVRFALAWLLCLLLLAEIVGASVARDALAYGPLAWLAAAGARRAGAPEGRWVRISGAALQAAAGLAIAGLALAAAVRFGGEGATTVAVLGGGATLAAAATGAVLLLLRRPFAAAAASLALGLLAHAVLAGALAPRLDALWVSQRAVALLERTGLDPRNGVTPGPVAATGYAEPSLAFALGDAVEFDTPQEAADALAVGGAPALVEADADPAFRAALARAGAGAQPVGRIEGFDYAAPRPVSLTLWRPRPAPHRSPPP